MRSTTSWLHLKSLSLNIKTSIKMPKRMRSRHRPTSSTAWSARKGPKSPARSAASPSAPVWASAKKTALKCSMPICKSISLKVKTKKENQAKFHRKVTPRTRSTSKNSRSEVANASNNNKVYQRTNRKVIYIKTWAK